MTLKKQQNKLNVKTMGVINITPNSFSDGGKYQSLVSLKKMIQTFDILDIGAESTAPFNSSISSKDELQRFEDHFFPYLSQIKDPQKTISIDTYKPEVFYEVALYIKRFWPKSKLIFNDISGKVDSELLYLMADSLDFDYVLCHNLCSSRSLASKHMDFLSDSVVDSVSTFFEENAKLLEFKRNIYADPCFGFSKTYEQNHELLKNLNCIRSLDLYHSIVIGVSKKSFLRKPKELKLSDNVIEIEQIHSNILFDLFNNMNSKLVVRTHSVTPVVSAMKSVEFMK